MRPPAANPEPPTDGRVMSAGGVRGPGEGQQAKSCGPVAWSTWINPEAADVLGLSQRQRDVLCGVAAGMTNDAIGTALGLTINTVKMHVGRLCRQIGANDRAHAVALAYDKGALRTAAARARIAARAAA